jgi:hypothetical protein
MLEWQFTNKLLTGSAPYNSPLWDMIPVSRSKSMAAKLITGYIFFIYAFVLTYVCLIFIIRIENTFIINILNSPFETIRDFFTAPFVPIPQPLWLSPFYEYDYGKELAGLTATLIGLFPLLMMAVTSLGLDIYNALSCKFSKSTPALSIAIGVEFALLLFVGLAFYGIDVNRNGTITLYFNDLIPYTISAASIFTVIGEVRTFIGIFVIVSLLCLAAHHPLSRHCNNLD